MSDTYPFANTIFSYAHSVLNRLPPTPDEDSIQFKPPLKGAPHCIFAKGPHVEPPFSWARRLTGKPAAKPMAEIAGSYPAAPNHPLS